MKVLARIPSPAGGRSSSDRPVLVATAVTAACLVAVGVAGSTAIMNSTSIWKSFWLSDVMTGVRTSCPPVLSE